MSDGTKIQWTDASWNPIRANRSVSTDPDYSDRRGMELLGADGWHCERVSPGCQHCYAEALNEKRFGTGLPYNRRSRDLVEVFLHQKVLTEPLRWRKPRRVFVCSMTDLFGEWVPDEMIDRVFAVMALTPQHTFQVLTKRPERMREYLTAGLRVYQSTIDGGRLPVGGAFWPEGEAATRIIGEISRLEAEPTYPRLPNWPLPNVWLGVSVEDQERADQRIPELLATPAAVRFLSCEPLLGPLELERWLHDSDCWLARAGWEDGAEPAQQWWCICNEPREDHISWVIVGGESGGKARPFDLEWARSVVRQCQAAGVPVFYKQGGAANRCPHDRKGGHFECFPDDLKVREFPNAIR